MKGLFCKLAKRHSASSSDYDQLWIAMNEPKSLDSLFKEKLFRIPAYQRGYAWAVSNWTPSGKT
jgi:hypothetical protein